MRKYLELSAIALLTTAISALPAYALSLNLGGDGPLVDLGNDNNADATVSLDTGNLLNGGSGGGSDGTNADAVIDLNLGSVSGDGDSGLIGGNGLIDLNGDNDNGLIDLDGDLLNLGGGTGGGLLDLGGDGDLIDLAGLNLGDGSLLDLSGNDDVDAAIEIDLGDGDLLDLGSTGGIGGIGGTGGLLDLGGDGDLLDLGGDGDLLDLGGSTQLLALDLGGTNVDADLNLDGGDEPIVDVTISNDEGGLAGTGVLPNTETEATVGGGNAATVKITDTSDDDSGNGGGGNGGGGNGGGGNGNGGNGSGGNGNGSGGSGSGGAGNGGGDGSLFATNGAACLTLTPAQVDELIRRHVYNRATFNSWASAQSLRVVEVDLCAGEMAEVAAAAGADANVARLQAFLAAQAKVRAGLQSKGHAPGDVIAADHSGEILTVYVI